MVSDSSTNVLSQLLVIEYLLNLLLYYVCVVWCLSVPLAG